MTVTADQITRHVLEDGDVRVAVLSMGGAVQSWQVDETPVTLGYADPADYIANPYCMGALMGRVANRTAGASFDLEGHRVALTPNTPLHHIHGGPGGLAWRNWQLDPGGPRALRLRHVSPDGDQGYPGKVIFEVTLTLADHALTWEMTATPDRVTPINMCQHLYFNLMGTRNIRDHDLQIAAARWTPTDEALIPTGEIAPVDGTIYDFRAARRIGDVAPRDRTHDANLALDPNRDGPAVMLRAPSGMTLRMWTDRPGLQVYTCGMLGRHGTPSPGPDHGPWAALCLEAQGFPNALNTPAFPSILCSPDAPYRQTLRIAIAPETA